MTILQVALAVGGPDGVPLAEASAFTASAAGSGVTAIRLVEGALDPSVVASYLAGVHSGVNYVVEIPTTHHAPYNTARRVLSLDRAAGGRAGVALLAGGGDEVSDATAPDPAAGDAVRRWREYARVLTRLWESFPREALLGDQEAALVVDETLIRPIDHEGEYYRVAGPLDGPSSVQGRPVVVADLGVLDAAAVAESADIVVTGDVEGADAALTEALRQAGRSRRDVALLGRATGGPAAELLGWAREHRLDGIELATADPEAVLREWPRTLRHALGVSA